MKMCNNCCGLINDVENESTCAFGNNIFNSSNNVECEDFGSDYVTFDKDICDHIGNVVFIAGNKYKILLEECGDLYVSHGKKNKNECSIIPSNIRGMNVYNGSKI